MFVDFDTKEVLGIAPYWKPDVMKQRFGRSSDSDTVHMKHDYVIYLAHEEELMRRYEENAEKVKTHVQKLIEQMENISGQWSMDIMQNADEFWIIDMALAVNSALRECVPEGLLKVPEEDWIPELGD